MRPFILARAVSALFVAALVDVLTRFALLALSIVATAVIVTIVMFETLAMLAA